MSNVKTYIVAEKLIDIAIPIYIELHDSIYIDDRASEGNIDDIKSEHEQIIKKVILNAILTETTFNVKFR